MEDYRYRCPVCVKLPLDGPPLGIEAPPFKYNLGHDQAKFEKSNTQCDLYRLVRDLHRIWLENGEGSRGKYWYSCSPWYSICTDPGVWDILPASSEAFVHPNPLDPSTIARLQTWIDRCDQEHEGCHGERYPVLPTRILDLGEPGFTGNVKLVETNSHRGQYIALSHCWGASNSFLTTRDTIESRKNGFLPDQAPATFRDAIMLARCLEIRYLWIDSLCIIQGDKEDWNVEASRMGDVYRNAYLMVAAANAADDTQGFLKSRPKIQCSMNVVAPTGQAAKVYLRPQNYKYDNKDLPLESRGWTLQESYLCRRQLRFMHQKIIWDCQSTQWDELDRDVLEKKYQSGTHHSVARLFPENESRHSVPYEEWYGMIVDFATRKFSVQTDRLPALSGLAALVAAQKKGRYCAGLWWEDIGYSICWTPGLHRSRPDLYIAPSWSWASIIGPVTFPDVGYAAFFPTPETLDAVVFRDYKAIHRGSNQYGEIECAWLELEAPLAPIAKVKDEKLEERDQHPHWRECEYFSILDTKNEEVLRVEFDFKEEEVDELFALFLMCAVDRDTGRHAPAERLRSSAVELSGLVLRPTLDPGKIQGQYSLPKGFGLYQRVGFFKVVTRQAKQKFLEMAPVTNIALL
ncbi:HET-domain-containing protein [Hyaloscypha variabilis F]|uniref:HET-domain-containing protein n=1 Tax=Hyaloscypha variabilis (strain UAMH 11265 / GT02V1 / F) TaxID=1149755 RepID=A0A2J6RWS0_HYAVF|nr:HET-domain-containing protein [Hyaloscypha variabilis F]